jgi:stearoyl-CoA desaturase (delta-9 desaturase)
MSTQATIWFHRYSTHKAYTFSHPIWRFITQNLVLRTFPEEIYVVSHHVHHAKSDQPGDPYNAQGGLLYCMLSDVNHQPIAKDLTETDYRKAASFLRHTGVWINSYESYLTWGSIASPVYTTGLWLLNWLFWYTVFFLIGGHGLACALFTGALFWFVLVRAFNYTGHGKGQQKHVDGVDFDRRNLSLNQLRPGLFSGEWHNNHHLYPSSARAGFLRFQLDLAWVCTSWERWPLTGITKKISSKNMYIPSKRAHSALQKLESGCRSHCLFGCQASAPTRCCRRSDDSLLFGWLSKVDFIIPIERASEE